MQGPGSDRENVDGILRELFSSDLEPVSHRNHPGDEVLVTYLKGQLSKGWSDPESVLQQIRSESVGDVWQRNEVTAHLLTCARCKNQIEVLREDIAEVPVASTQSWFRTLSNSFGSMFRPIPRPAVATMAVQFVVIVGLGALLLSQPSIFTSGTAALSSSSARLDTAESSDAAAAADFEEVNTLPQPGPVIETKFEQDINSPDANTRISAVESLNAANLPNLGLLADAFVREEDSTAKDIMGEAFSVHLFGIQKLLQDAYTKVYLLQRNYEDSGDFPLATNSEDFRNNINTLFHSLGDLSMQLGRAQVLCSPTKDLNLDFVITVLGQADSILIIDPYEEPGKFRVQLPALNPNDARVILQRRLEFVCN